MKVRHCILADHRPSIAIEPTIGHMKIDGRLARNPLKGALGDALHAVIWGLAITSGCRSRSYGFFVPKWASPCPNCGASCAPRVASIDQWWLKNGFVQDGLWRLLMPIYSV